MTIASTVINQLSTTQANFQGFVNFWGGVWIEFAKGLDSYTNPSSSEPARNGGLSSMIGGITSHPVFNGIDPNQRQTSNPNWMNFLNAESEGQIPS
jgi:hypothetical protein